MRTVLVTGHTKGIGFAITQALLKQGDKVIGVARSSIEDQSNLKQFSIDLLDAENLEKAIKELVKALRQENNKENPIDAVVCNAGAGQFGALENFSATHIQQNLQLNLISPLVMLKLLLSDLKQHSRSDIIFIASESALQGGRYGSIYSAGKFGLRGAAQALRHECASANCHVGVVNPGMVRTDFFEELNFEPGSDVQHALQADDVAQAVISMLTAPDNAVIEEINVSPLQHVVQKKKS